MNLPNIEILKGKPNLSAVIIKIILGAILGCIFGMWMVANGEESISVLWGVFYGIGFVYAWDIIRSSIKNISSGGAETGFVVYLIGGGTSLFITFFLWLLLIIAIFSIGWVIGLVKAVIALFKAFQLDNSHIENIDTSDI